MGDSLLSVDHYCIEGNLEPKYEYPCAIEIGTLEGPHQCNPGDFIIKGIKGEFYPCKPDIFKSLYDEVKTEPIPEVPATKSGGCNGSE